VDVPRQGLSSADKQFVTVVCHERRAWTADDGFFPFLIGHHRKSFGEIATTFPDDDWADHADRERERNPIEAGLRDRDM
jgi:hypothetical protein